MELQWTKELKMDETALWSAAIQGHLESVDLLLEKGANVENRGLHETTPLIIASQEGKLETVQLLITKGKANVHAKDKLGRTALFMAALQ